MKAAGIYKIQSTIKPERVYIGSAVKISKRWMEHLYGLRSSNHGNSKLQRHYNKYGESDLVFSVLCVCDKEDLIIQEQFFIDSHAPWFNISPTAGNSFGIKRSEETKQKNREAGKRTKNFSGHKHTKETLLKLRDSHIGQIAWNKGLKQSEERRAKNSIVKMGNNNMLGKKHSDEAKKKMSESRKGKTASAETKQRMSEGQKRAFASRVQTSLNITPCLV